MTIDEAIKTNEGASDYLFRAGKQEYAKAVELGIEALKQIKVYRDRPLDFLYYLLPGETED